MGNRCTARDYPQIKLGDSRIQTRLCAGGLAPSAGSCPEIGVWAPYSARTCTCRPSWRSSASHQLLCAVQDAWVRCARDNQHQARRLHRAAGYIGPADLPVSCGSAEGARGEKRNRCIHVFRGPIPCPVPPAPLFPAIKLTCATSSNWQ